MSSLFLTMDSVSEILNIIEKIWGQEVSKTHPHYVKNLVSEGILIGDYLR